MSERSATKGPVARRWRAEPGVGLPKLLGIVAVLFAVTWFGSAAARANLWDGGPVSVGPKRGSTGSLALYKELVRARTLGPRARKAALKRLAGRLESRLAADSQNPLLWYLLGVTREEFDLQGSVRAFLRARRFGWDARLGAGISFHLALVYVRAHRCDLALAEYRRSMVASREDSDRAVIAANAAECEMSLGRLTRAIDGYRRALRFRRDSAGALWGLAVALDRDGRTTRALQVARAALRQDPKRLSLVGPGVFFVPKAEVEYYLALADLAAGRGAGAAGHFRAYLDALADSPWRARAHAHLAALGNEPKFWKVQVGPVAKMSSDLGSMESLGAAGSDDRGKVAVPVNVRRRIVEAFRRCLAQVPASPKNEVVLRLDFLVARSGQVHHVQVWPDDVRRGCFLSVAKRLVLPEIAGRSLSLRAHVLVEWGPKGGVAR